MRTPSDGGRKEGEMRTWIWIGARPAGAEERAVGRHCEKTWPALGNGLWERARAVYVRPGEPSIFYFIFSKLVCSGFSKLLLLAIESS